MRNRWLAATIVLLVAVAVVMGGVIVHQHDEVDHAHRQLDAATVQISDEHLATLRAQGQLAPAQHAARQSRRQLGNLQHRLAHPHRGPVRSRTMATPNGVLYRLAPAGTQIIAVRRIPAAGSGPTQLAVIWRLKERYHLPALGFLLWNGGHTFGLNQRHQWAYRRWHLAYDWRQSRNGQSSVGSPGHLRSVHDPVGETFSDSVGDATGDGVPEVLVSLDTDGSGGCTTWRLLQTQNGRTTSIFRRFICDGGVTIHDGLVQITRAVHAPHCSIHGCGTSHRILLKRENAAWVVISRSIIGHRTPSL